MRRRWILQFLAATAGALPFRPWQAWAQTVTFPGNQASTFEALAFVTLPASLGRERSTQWIRKQAKIFGTSQWAYAQAVRR